MINVNEVINDGEIIIAVGKSRRENVWENKTIMFSQLLKRLSNTIRTKESCEEFKNMDKSKRDEIKDVGGFVGGCVKDGIRRKDTIECRYVVTLDLDYVEGEIWTTIKDRLPFACVLYSTHSNREGNPRLRLIMPLSRGVLPDEYEAIARKLASYVGMEVFDDTTYEPSRLMYWPSTPRDGNYIFHHQDKLWVNPNEVLGSYGDWTDRTSWPESSRVRTSLKNTVTRQQDPLEKDSIIGVFCRTYTMSETIDEFLYEVYDRCEYGDRYTYKNGSTSGGMVVYEDKFAFSHHGTDPVGGILCNAFDLVRIHKFGQEDKDAKENTPVNKLPSYIKMRKMVEEDARSKETLKRENRQRILDAFSKEEDYFESQGDIGDEHKKQSDLSNKTLAEESVDKKENRSCERTKKHYEDSQWLENLVLDKKGACKCTINNFSLIMENDSELKGKILYNDFFNRAVVRGKLPWRSENNKKDWGEADDANLKAYLEKFYGMCSFANFEAALIITFEKHSFHPVKEYLNSLTWDGVKRIETLLIDYLGATDTEYTRTVTRKLLTAGVARIQNPGIKYDNMMVVSGPQGIGKSTLIRKLGKSWYSDSLTCVQGKDAYEQLQGVWIIEMGEMMATRKSDIEAVKHFLSKTEDIYRAAYGRYTNRYPRQCIFIGTTNDKEFLRDKTGNRRFWPVDVGVVERKKSPFTDLDEEIDMIWAEAVHLWKNGENIYLSQEESKELQKHQKSHLEINAKTGVIEEYLNIQLPNNWNNLDTLQRKNYIQGNGTYEKLEGIEMRNKTCALEIWCELFSGDPKQFTSMMAREINDVLSGLEGWEKHSGALRFGKYYGQQRAFVRKTQ